MPIQYGLGLRAYLLNLLALMAAEDSGTEMDQSCRI